MSYLKFIISFFLKGLFQHPDEYNINSKRFNIAKVFFVGFFFLCFILFMFLSFRFYDLGSKHILLKKENAALVVKNKEFEETEKSKITCSKKQSN